MDVWLVLVLLAVALAVWAFFKAPAHRKDEARRTAGNRPGARAAAPRAPAPRPAAPVAPPPAPLASPAPTPPAAGAVKPTPAVAPPQPPAQAQPLPLQPVEAATATDPAAAEDATVTAAEPVPEELANFVTASPEDMDNERRAMLLDSLRRVPRPSRAFHRLASPDMVSDATSAELGVIVSAEPQVAAKVLATVNSPLFQLQRPVVHLGQAITFLGLNSVRAICLRYMLEETFSAKSFEQKRLFDSIWHASTIAGELCLRLAQKLGFPEPGALLGPMVLDFLGRFGCAALMPQDSALAVANASLLKRMTAEQQSIGVAAPALTVMLLREWNLPESILEEVIGIDAVMQHPAAPLDPANPAAAARDARRGLSWFCARLAERIALQGDQLDLAGATAPGTPEFHHFRSYLALPQLARLPEVLQAPDIVRLIQGMRAPKTA